MKTLIQLQVEHHEDMAGFIEDVIAGRVATIPGIRSYYLIRRPKPRDPVEELREAGFTLSEIALGQQDIYRE